MTIYRRHIRRHSPIFILLNLICHYFSFSFCFYFLLFCIVQRKLFICFRFMVCWYCWLLNSYVSLFWESHCSWLWSTAYTTSCIYSVSNQRKLRFMISYHSSYYIPKVNSNLQNNLFTIISKCKSAGIFKNLKGKANRAFHFIDFSVLPFLLMIFILD